VLCWHRAGAPLNRVVRLKINMINPLDTKTFTEISSEEFELFVRDILKASSNELIDLKAVHRDKVEGVDGTYEIDVTARFRALGVDFLVLVECKHHKNPIKREAVQILRDRIRSTGAQKGMIFSTSNFQRGALEFAKKHRIALVRVAEGKTSYETREQGASVDPPPWVKIPPFVGWWFQLTDGGPITSSLISSDLSDYLNEYLNSRSDPAAERGGI